MKNKLIKLIVMVFAVIVLVGCSTQANQVSHNVSQQADNFNVVRRVVVTNMRTDSVVFEVIGNISIDTQKEGRLDVIVEVEEGVYKKHMINMTEWNMYAVEDLHGIEVNKYRYEVNYMPETIMPIEIISVD